MVQRERLHVSTAGYMGSIPGAGTKILQASWYSPPKKVTEERSTFKYTIQYC